MWFLPTTEKEDDVTHWWCPACLERYELAWREREWPNFYVNGLYGASKCGGKLVVGLDGVKRREYHNLEPRS